MRQVLPDDLTIQPIHNRRKERRTFLKAKSASSTALLIARSIMLANATPTLQPLLVGETAALTRRLLDVAEPSPLFDLGLRHPWARHFLFAIERLTLPGVLLHWLARKWLIDGLARDALAAGCRQVVVLGAGLDTLASRLHSECPCFELDHPATQSIKACAFPDELVLVPADLMNASPAGLLLAEPRYSPDEPTLFVAEGLLMYLPPERVAALLCELSAFAAPGSRFVFTFMEAREGRPTGFHNGRRIIDWWLRWRSEPFRWEVARADVELFAARHGWQLGSLSSPEGFRGRFLAPHGLADRPLAVGESIALVYCRAK